MSNDAETALRPSARNMLYVCFFLSGIAGLIYEVVWEKYLALFAGSTGVAQIVVLATFMGGLALGNWMFGRVADRFSGSLMMYVLLELGIGAYALAFDTIFHAGRWVFLSMVGGTGVTSLGLLIAKIASCSFCILVPAVLMGGTLPALSRYLIRTDAQIGRRLSMLYFLNSFGAVCGCILAGFFLIKAFGLEFSMVAGAFLNFAVGAFAWVVSRGQAAGRGAEAAPSCGSASVPVAWRGGVLLVCVALSGAVAMVYEVAWIRLLTLVLGGSTYAFSLMLATFILGLSIGGFVLSFWNSNRGYGTIFGFASVLVGCAVLVSMPFYVRLPFVFNQIAASLTRDREAFGFYHFAQVFLCMLVMIVPTILQGVTLPAAARVIASDIGSLGRRVGMVFSVNTLGTVAGVVFAGFAGLPLLGIKGTLELGVAINIVVGILVLVVCRRLDGVRWPIPTALLCVVPAIAAYMWGAGNWDSDVMLLGTYRVRVRIPDFGALREAARARETLFHRDGMDATVAVQDLMSEGGDRLLVINGKADASTGSDMPTQKMIGHLPMLCGVKAKNVLVIGVGSGATIAAVLSHGVESVDVVELSRDVITASRYFGEVNGRYWEDPRVHVHWEDAKTYLQVTDKKYDVIISEPTNPWVAGVAGVFSVEYFRDCRKRLNDGGLFVQWIQAYELEDATFFLMLETFAREFPYYTMWNPARTDTVFVGAPRPYKVDIGAFDRAFESASVRRDLAVTGIESPLSVLLMQMNDRSERGGSSRWIGAVHSDFFPVLEYAAARGFFVGSNADAARMLDDRGKSPVRAGLWLRSYLERRKPDQAEFISCYNAVERLRGMCGKLPLMVADAWGAAYPDSKEAMRAMGMQVPAGHHARLSLLEQSGETGASVVRERCRMLYDDYVQRRHCLRAPDAGFLADLERLCADRGLKEGYEPRLWLAEVLSDQGRDGESIPHLAAAADMLRPLGGKRDEYVRTCVKWCEALVTTGKVSEARSVFEKHLGTHKSVLSVRLTESLILEHEGKTASSGS